MRLVEGPRFARFCVVGLLGVGINLGLFQALHISLVGLGVAEAPALFGAAAVGTEVSILCNFVLNDQWTFQDRRRPGGAARRAVEYNLLYLGGVGLQLGLLFLLHQGLGLQALGSNLVAIGASTVLNYGVSKGRVWGRGS